MPVLHSCKDCILDGDSLSYDRPVKLHDHETQKTHQMVEQAYERGVQQGRKFAEDEAKHAAHLPAGSCAQEPQEPMMARWLYIQAFEDGKQAAQDEHNLVMKAMVETHNAQLDIVFKRGQDYKAMAGEALSWSLMNTQVRPLQQRPSLLHRMLMIRWLHQPLMRQQANWSHNQKKVLSWPVHLPKNQQTNWS